MFSLSVINDTHGLEILGYASEWLKTETRFSTCVQTKLHMGIYFKTTCTLTKTEFVIFVISFFILKFIHVALLQ